MNYLLILIMISSMPKLDDHMHVINRCTKLLEYLRIKKIITQKHQDDFYCINGSFKKKIQNKYYKIAQEEIICEVTEKGLRIYHELWINDLYVPVVSIL